MIVYRVREMIGGNAVRFENNDVLIVFRHGDIDVYKRQIYDKALLPAVGVAVSSFDISAEVEKKIGEMDVKDVEKLCLSVMKRELNAITWLGGLIGLLLGIVNIFL